MKPAIETLLKKATGAAHVRELGVLQRLWSGYGSITRYGLEGVAESTVILKHVSPPSGGAHPRGWDTDHSHARKLRSYAVETAWYRGYANRCDAGCRIPRCWGVETVDNEAVMVLEDLDAAGFPVRKTRVDDAELRACLTWLANFHARFLGVRPDGLWRRGTYWHLATRPDELVVLADEDPGLHAAAGAIDAQLKAARFQTLVHGDAKLANFCFSKSGTEVAAVDFQYVGAGSGVQDVAYFIGSCLRDDECADAEAALLDTYFAALRAALHSGEHARVADALEAEWRALFPVAWTDFHRFLKGWSPGHWKIHGYSERLAERVVAQLGENAE